MNVEAIGTVCFGVVIGWTVRYFIMRFKQFDVKSLSGVVTIFAGGVAIEFIKQNPETIFYYPIGLLIGFALYSVVAFLVIRYGSSSGGDDENDHRAGGGAGGGGYPFQGPVYK